MSILSYKIRGNLIKIVSEMREQRPYLSTSNSINITPFLSIIKPFFKRNIWSSKWFLKFSLKKWSGKIFFSISKT